MDKIGYAEDGVFSSMLHGITEDEWARVERNSKRKTFKSGEILINEGVTGQEFYIIISGRVAATKVSELSGETIELGILKEGDIIGEMAIITNKPRSATIIAIEDTVVLVVDMDNIRQDPEAQPVYVKIMHNLALELSKKILYLGDKLVKYDEKDRHKFDLAEDRYPTPPNSILVLFGWKWLDIMHEVPFLAEHGYDAIKISPPQEFVLRSGNPWWEIYQPVSYNLSRFYGTQEEFIKMVDFCHGYGIKVYADLVINHMADFSLDESQRIGTNGTKFAKYCYGPLNGDNDYYGFDDFYHFHDGGNKQISHEDYSTLEGAWHLEHYDFLNLPKLNLKSRHVIDVLRKYVKYLLSLGIDGFRLDAAKHLSMKSVERLLLGLRTQDSAKPFIYQEYYANVPMGIDLHSFMEKYFRIGYVTSFKYGEFLADAILGRNNNLQKLVEYSFGSSWIHYPENRTVTVIDNHDTERMMENMLNYRSTENNAYVLAYIFMLAWPFGVPKIMSSFKFTSHDDAIPKSAVWQNGRCTCFDKDSQWIVQHRWDAIANMVLFRSRTIDAPGVSHRWVNGNQIAFARVSEKPGKAVVAKGFIAINATAHILRRRFETGLPSGKYYNLIASRLSLGKMHGPLITVEKYGHATIEIGPHDAVALLPSFTNGN